MVDPTRAAVPAGQTMEPMARAGQATLVEITRRAITTMAPTPAGIQVTPMAAQMPAAARAAETMRTHALATTAREDRRIKAIAAEAARRAGVVAPAPAALPAAAVADPRPEAAEVRLVEVRAAAPANCSSTLLKVGLPLAARPFLRRGLSARVAQHGIPLKLRGEQGFSGKHPRHQVLYSDDQEGRKPIRGGVGEKEVTAVHQRAAGVDDVWHITFTVIRIR